MIEILFQLTLLIWGGHDYEEVDIYWTDGIYRYCASMVSCYLPEENEIWINMKYIHLTDRCERDPWTHEVLHHIYGDEDVVHPDCNLKIYKGMIVPLAHGR